MYATNRDLEAMCAAGTFREDLYERMSGVLLHMPPARQMFAEVRGKSASTSARSVAEESSPTRRRRRS